MREHKISEAAPGHLVIDDSDEVKALKAKRDAAKNPLKAASQLDRIEAKLDYLIALAEK